MVKIFNSSVIRGPQVEDTVAEAVYRDIMTEFSKFDERHQPTNLKSFMNINEYTQKKNYT